MSFAKGTLLRSKEGQLLSFAKGEKKKWNIYIWRLGRGEGAGEEVSPHSFEEKDEVSFIIFNQEIVGTFRDNVSKPKCHGTN